MKTSNFFLSLCCVMTVLTTGCSSVSENTEVDKASTVYCVPVDDAEAQYYTSNKRQLKTHNTFLTNFESFNARHSNFTTDNRQFDKIDNRIESDQRKSYTVKKNDTLFGIAKREHVNATQFMQMNGLTTRSILRIGQKLNLPAANSNYSKVTKIVEKETTSSKNNKIIPATAGNKYVVKKGDVLGTIAVAHKVSVASLKTENNLHNDKIFIGQKLRIPNNAPKIAKPNNQVTPTTIARQLDSDGLYTIKSGDTLGKIAAALNINETELANTNGLNANSQLQIGKKLLVPSTQAKAEDAFEALVKETAVEQPKNEKQLTNQDAFFDDFDDIPIIELK